MAKTSDYHVLSAACTHKGCPICQLLHESTRRYLDAWRYELFTDTDLRTELRHTRGFCHTHTWQLAQMGAALPLAQAYREVLSDTLEQLQQPPHTPTSSDGLLRRFFTANRSKRPACPACKQREQATARYAHSLRLALLDEEFYTLFSASSGLCLEHFETTCTLKASDTPGDWFSLLRSAQLICLQRLDEQLGEMIRKYDYRFKGEAQGDEMLSWQWAAGIVAGETKQ